MPCSQGAVVVHAVRPLIELLDRIATFDRAVDALVGDARSREELAQTVEVGSVDQFGVAIHQRCDRVMAFPRPYRHPVTLECVRMSKVQLGFFSFTEITDPAEHRSYNEWHQLDHIPEQYPLAGIVYGQRWVSTPACRAARAVSEPLLDPIHYLTLYLLAAPIEETLREFMELGAELAKVGRFHQHRRAHLSGPLFVQQQAA